MIQILRFEHYLWRNALSPRPVAVATVSFGDAWGWTASNKTGMSLTDGARAALADALPAFAPPNTIPADTDAPAMLAALAQAFTNIGDPATPHHGVAARDEARRTATVFFAAFDPAAAATELSLAVNAFAALAGNAEHPLEECLEAAFAVTFDQSSRALLAEATRRCIPWRRVMPATLHIHLGHGARGQLMRETMGGGQGALARELVRNKFFSFEVMSAVHLPVGRYAAVRDAATALRAADSVGYPLVLKPVHGKKGIGVFADLRSRDELSAALARAALRDEPYLLQTMFPGDDYRLLVLDGKFFAAARRTAASVTGDGTHTIAGLVAVANTDPRRGKAYTRAMNFIVLDNETARVLARHGLTQDSVPAAGAIVRLRATANIATGGVAFDVTDAVHPDNARMAERAARATGSRIAGVDFLTPDISRSWRKIGGGICEVNLFPGIRVHLIANPKARVVEAIMDTMFAPGDDGSIPTALIAGEGAARVAAMVAEQLAAAGHVVGVATNEGATIGGERIDARGLAGSIAVLRDATVTAAVLEATPGAMGLCVGRCTAAAVLSDVPEAAAVIATAIDTIVLGTDDAAIAALAGKTRAHVVRCAETDSAARECSIAAALARALAVIS